MQQRTPRKRRRACKGWTLFGTTEPASGGEVIARRSRTTITRACISGKLKAVQTGNKWNINRDSLLAYAGLI